VAALIALNASIRLADVGEIHLLRGVVLGYLIYRALRSTALHFLRSTVRLTGRELDKELEIQKEGLCMNENFNILDIFKMFDKNNQGFISQEDFENQDRDFVENPELLIKKFDKDQ